MFMNVTGFKEELPKMLEFAKEKNWIFEAYDQGLLQIFFKNRTDGIPIEFNWKPYWGLNKNASIVHFHASKFNKCVEHFITLRYTIQDQHIRHSTDEHCKHYEGANIMSQTEREITVREQMYSPPC